jgi:transcriptional regulator with XRE-family HTH domain
LFGQRLAQARIRAGLTLRGLAQRMSSAVSPQAIRQYEQGEITPTAEIMISLASALNVTLDSLTSDHPTKRFEQVDPRSRDREARADARYCKEFFGQRLRQARKAAGLSLHELGAQLSPSRSAQSINNYEKGLRLPSSELLRCLREVLGNSLDELLSAGRPKVGAVTFYRRFSSWGLDSVSAEDEVRRELSPRLELEAMLEIRRGEFQLNQTDRISLQAGTQIEAVVQSLRDKWGLGRWPIVSVTELLESVGVRVIRAALPGKLAAISCRADLHGGLSVADLVVASTEVCSTELRFALCRELARRLIRSQKHHVQMAHWFASFAGALLVPQQALWTLIGRKRTRVDASEVADLSDAFGVSQTLVLSRLAATNILPAPALKGLRDQLTTQETGILPIERSAFDRFEHDRQVERLARRALAEGLISPFRAEQYIKRGHPLQVSRHW